MSNFVHVTVTDLGTTFVRLCTVEQARRWYPDAPTVPAGELSLAESVEWLGREAENENYHGLVDSYEKLAGIVRDVCGGVGAQRVMQRIAEEGGLL